jgi:alpha-beta hydrolase superfamily lysophospholipase
MGGEVEAEPPLRRVESHFHGSGGRRLFRRAWLPAAPSRAVILVHGFAEHSGRYEELAGFFAGRRCAVHAYDHRGHGRSEGPRGHVRSFDAFLDDLGRFVELVREEHPDVPLHLVGHSMGGLVTLAFLVERRPRIAAAVTSGPALVVDGVPRWRRLVARLLARLGPRLSLPAGLDPQGLSRDPEVVREYQDDPLVFRKMSAGLGASLLDAAERTAHRAAEVQVPLLMLHGEEDPLCPARGSREFFREVATRGSALHVYPGLRHEIFNEPERRTVYEDLWRWLEEISA